PHSPGQPPHAGGGNAAEHTGLLGGLDRRPAKPQAREQNARHQAQTRRPAGPARLSAQLEMRLETPIAKSGEVTVDVAFDDSMRRALERTWGTPAGVGGWLGSSDHRSIGTRFIVTAFVFFLLGGILALLMRLQLARPKSRFQGPYLYNQ